MAPGSGLWLTGESTWLAVPGRIEELSLPHAANLADVRHAVIADGALTVCSQCVARRDLTETDLPARVGVSTKTVRRWSAVDVAAVTNPHDDDP